jgi:hypothetical protein
MKFSPSYDRGLSLLRVSTSENCDTDSWPMVPEVFFRHYQGAFDPEYSAVAAAMLFSRHCGTVADFDDARMGIDAARAVRAILPEVEEIMPIDGARREIGQGVASLVVGEAERIFDGRMKRGAVGKSARAVTWSGDFLANGAHNSTQFIGGDIFTNALMVAASTNISVALALLIGGRSLRDIYVPAPTEDEQPEFDRLAGGLDLISIKLHAI